MLGHWAYIASGDGAMPSRKELSDAAKACAVVVVQDLGGKSRVSVIILAQSTT